MEKLLTIRSRATPGLLVTAAALLFLGNLPAGAQESQPAGSRLKAAVAVLEKFAAEVPLPGFSAVIAGRTGAFWTGAWGVENPVSRLPMTDRTLVPMGSITKSLTALAVMQLAEEKLVDLDDPVVKHLPWFRLADPSVSDRITLRHCLTNTSGIPSLDRWQTLEPTLDEGVMEEEIRLLRGVRSRTEPGKSFEYVNENWTILGLVLKKIRGGDFGQILQERVFDPLGMTSTTTIPRRVAREKSAAGNYFTPDGFSPATASVSAAALPAGSSLVSQAVDFGAYLGFLLSGGRSPVTGRQVVSEAGLKEILRPAVSFPVFPREFRGGEAPGYYSMGWISAEVDGRTLYFHGGNTGRTTTMTVFDLRSGFGAAILSTSPGELDRYRFESFLGVLNRVLLALEGQTSTGWGRPLGPDPNRQEAVMDPGKDWLASLEGPWISPEGVRLVLGAGADAASLAASVESRIFTGAYRVEFLDRSRVVFSNLSGTLSGRFEVGADGKASLLRGPLGQEFRRQKASGGTGVGFGLGRASSRLPLGWLVRSSGNLNVEAEGPSPGYAGQTLRAGVMPHPEEGAAPELLAALWPVSAGKYVPVNPPRPPAEQISGAWTTGRFWESVAFGGNAPGETAGILAWTREKGQVYWFLLQAPGGEITGAVRRVLRPLISEWTVME